MLQSHSISLRHLRLVMVKSWSLLMVKTLGDIRNLCAPVEELIVGGTALISLMDVERRHDTHFDKQVELVLATGLQVHDGTRKSGSPPYLVTWSVTDSQCECCMLLRLKKIFFAASDAKTKSRWTASKYLLKNRT